MTRASTTYFMIPCRFGTTTVPVPLHIGEPSPGAHPLEQQADWLQRTQNGSIPLEVMDSFAKLLSIANENDVSFRELCAYAMDMALADVDDSPVAPAPMDGSSDT
ncbi:DUF2610 domain-containing protein [Micromonospora sp. NPDC048839]|uniref:DUF2610 domain-containing protein n=1 Tax=Micromonospora sp. NPDC048839 TaxID=3155641 RepID=UPI00340A08FA